LPIGGAVNNLMWCGQCEVPMTHPKFGVNMPNRAVKRLIVSKIKVCVYILYVDALCTIISYIYKYTHIVFFVFFNRPQCQKHITIFVTMH